MLKNLKNYMEKRRVVVTGIGALTPIGNTAPEFWEGLVAVRARCAYYPF